MGNGEETMKQVTDWPGEVAEQGKTSRWGSGICWEVWPGLADRLECEGSIRQDSQVSGFSHWVAGDAILSMEKTVKVPDWGSTVECASLELLQFEGFLWYLTCLCQTGTSKGQDTRRNVWTKDIKLKITGLRLEPLSRTRWYQPRREKENVPGQSREQFRYLEDG